MNALKTAHDAGIAGSIWLSERCVVLDAADDVRFDLASSHLKRARQLEPFNLDAAIELVETEQAILYDESSPY